jgi:NADPH-dependent curcumin reductase CurA
LFCSFANPGVSLSTGWILDEILHRCAFHAVVLGCGQISAYNNSLAPLPYNLFPIVSHRIRFQGFIITDFFPRFDEGREALGKMLKEGKIKAEATIMEGGIKAAPEALVKLFEGGNTGKLCVKCL